MDVDVYVFASEADPGLVELKRESKDPQLRFIAATTGAFQAFAVLEVKGLQQLPQLMKDTFGNPTATGLQTAVPIKIGPRQIRWTKRYQHIAFSRIRARSGHARDALGSTATVDGYNGSAIVAGPFDVLVEFGADDLESLQAILMEGLHTTRGIAWSDTALVTSYYYREKPDEGR